jgi:rhodanese-related sulfurtransferase/uncharacterized membrane protein YedE/YeeE
VILAPEHWPTAVTAIPLGIAFGVILERTGLGDPRVISGQLTGRDFTVVRVMFGAIVTAMLGVVWLGAAGWIDPSTIAMPPTDLGAQALGAVVFGGGFALASLCPGTACVAASSGRRDGLAAVFGMLVGTALTAVLWPALGIVAADAPREGARLTTDLGWPLWVVVAVITTLGVIASIVARRFERRVERPLGATATSPWWRPTTLESVALTLAFAFAFASERPALAAAQVAVIAAQIANEEDHVDPLDLADMIRERREGLRIIDVREGLDSSTYVIPGAETVPLDELTSLEVSPRDHLVLYSDGGAHAAQAWVLLRARGLTDVKVLKDGMAAWEDEVLEPAPPAPSAVAEDTAQRRFKRARDLSLWFGGHVRLEASNESSPDELAPAPATPSAAPFVISPRAKDALAGQRGAPRKRRRNTC